MTSFDCNDDLYRQRLRKGLKVSMNLLDYNQNDRGSL